MKLFKKIFIPDNMLSHIKEREMTIEHSINKFRASFLIIIAILDTVSSFVVKEIHYTEKYEILGIFISMSGILSITIIYFFSRKKHKYYGFVKFFSITADLFITFAFAYGVLFWMKNPLPISQETFAILITIIFIFFNVLSVLRTNKAAVIYSGVLSFVLNTILFIGLAKINGNGVNMLIGYTSFFIIILSVFNLWVSEQILKSFIANKQLSLANDEITEQKNQIEQKNEELNQLIEEISSQRDEIEAQRDTVEQQKQHIETIHHEVEQSIDYATRLQQSILPDEKLLAKYTSDHFVFFRPKDKVSGDFYWWTHIENHTIITAADCTGHGVPGAFMSMLGISFLREIVQKEYVTHTGVILRKLRKEIIKALKQKGDSGEQKDGMDMAIISINHETNIVQFSGANNPLYIITNDELRIKNNPSLRAEGVAISTNNEQIISLSLIMTNNNYRFYEIKPDKMPIAIYEKMDNFTIHEMQLKKGDQLYLFSDGYADQFGGAKNKKFKYKPFKQLIIDNCELTMQKQKTVLEKTFDNWKGNLEQVDDITVVGIKI